MDNALDVHESTHMRQQGESPAKWWETYLKDPAFRQWQEVEAYKAQYKYFCKNTKAKKIRKKFLDAITASLSGEMYGNILSFEEAREKIKE